MDSSRLSRFLLPLALLIALSLPASARPWTMGDLAAERQTKADATPGGFTMDQSGQYDDEKRFPFPHVIETLEARLEAALLENGSRSGQETPRRDVQKGRLQWAYTEDFDGDGTKETFWAYSEPTCGGPPAQGLYFTDGQGKTEIVERAGKLWPQIIRAPGRTHFSYSGNSGTALSTFGGVIGYAGGALVRYLRTETGSYQKAGPYLYTVTRVSSAAEAAVYAYRWNEATERYEYAHWSALPLSSLPAAVRPFAVREGYTLTYAAQVPGAFYFLGFEDATDQPVYVRYLRELPDGACEEMAGYQWFGFAQLLEPPKDTQGSVAI